MNVRRSAAALMLGAALSVTGASAAFADATYPPATPLPTQATIAPTVEGVSVEVAPSASTLAFTGMDVLQWSVAGGLLLAGGGALIVATRRRASRA